VREGGAVVGVRERVFGGGGRSGLHMGLVSLCPFGHVGRSLPLGDAILLVVVVDSAGGAGVLHPHTPLLLLFLTNSLPPSIRFAGRNVVDGRRALALPAAAALPGRLRVPQLGPRVVARVRRDGLAPAARGGDGRVLRRAPGVPVLSHGRVLVTFTALI
jgi:hypothetical protein